MLELLHQAEKELPKLLEQDGWNSVDVTYHDPRVERVWRQWGENRINLHVIHPCKESDALFHPHPWPSAMRIVHGTYQMAVGYGEGTKLPPTACKVVLSAGSSYEMTNKDGWHAVYALHLPCYTVMISGKPWNREMPEEPMEKQGTLSQLRVSGILNLFRCFYP